MRADLAPIRVSEIPVDCLGGQEDSDYEEFDFESQHSC